MSDFTDNIKRIVGIEKLENRLKALENKTPIAGNRGIAYGVKGGGTVAKSGSSANDSSTGGITGLVDSAIQAANDAIAAAESGVNQAISDAAADATEGGSFDNGFPKGSLDGVFDAVDFFDHPSAGSLAGDAINSLLSGITGFTNGLGTNVAVYFDGMFRPPSSAYTTADESLAYDGWVSGYNWTNSSPVGTSPLPSAEQSALNYVAYYNSDEVKAITGEYVVLTSLVPSGVNYDLTVTIHLVSDDSVVGTSTSGINRSACTPGDANCPTTAPSSYLWPISDTIQLVQDKFSSGVIKSAVTFAANPRDPNVPLNLAGQQSIMDLYYDGDTRMGRIEPNNIGGSIISEINPTTKAYIGIARVYDNNGALKAYTDSTGIASYQP